MVGFACAQRHPTPKHYPIAATPRRVALSKAKTTTTSLALTMSVYRRNFVPGGTYFFTVNLEDRNLRLLTGNIELLRAAFRYTHARHPFTIDAIVVLPDHLHAIWTLPNGDADFSTRWMLIKSSFSRGLKAADTSSPSRQRRRERAIWQRRFWERTIRDEADFATHVDYIHYNPVKHGHAPDQAAWPYSSYRRWAALNAP